MCSPSGSIHAELCNVKPDLDMQMRLEALALKQGEAWR